MTAPISVPDDGRLRPQDDVPYEDWIADIDRAGDGPEPFFSGRDGDLTAAAAAMDMVSRGRGRGQTLCFSGRVISRWILARIARVAGGRV